MFATVVPVQPVEEVSVVAAISVTPPSDVGSEPSVTLTVPVHDPVTPPVATATNKVFLPSSGLLDASQFEWPHADERRPGFHGDLLAPWPKLKIFVKSPGMHACAAARHIRKGEMIAKFYGPVSTTATLYTLQAGPSTHVTCIEGGPSFVNHSCDPNAFFSHALTTATHPFPILTAMRDISMGEEICFNYNHNEWFMSSPFFCLCSSEKCLGKIEGFMKMDSKDQEEARHYLSPFIMEKWEEEKKNNKEKGQEGAATSSSH